MSEFHINHLQGGSKFVSGSPKEEANHHKYDLSLFYFRSYCLTGKTLTQKWDCILRVEVYHFDGIDGGEVEVLAAPPPECIMNSMDFADMKFETFGFMGKWNNFIGDPVVRFYAMISDKPKMGKSNMSADFAGYLARNHGETLFVAGEEKLEDALQKNIDTVNTHVFM